MSNVADYNTFSYSLLPSSSSALLILAAHTSLEITQHSVETYTQLGSYQYAPLQCLGSSIQQAIYVISFYEEG